MRHWRATREAGRPIPTYSDDDVLDFMVVEAVMLSVNEAQKRVQEDHQSAEWRGGHKGMSVADLAAEDRARRA